MSNPKSNESEDLLYKCDNSYIKELNVIRRQLNFIEINDEEEQEENDNTEDNCHQSFGNPPSPESSFNFDLYNCDERDLKRLNEIRRELNLVEIDSLNKSAAKNGESATQIPGVPGVCAFEGQSTKRADSHHRRKEKRKHKHKHHRTTKKEKIVEVLYSPPAKKMCFRESPLDLLVHEETPTSFQQIFQEEEEETLQNQNTESDNYTTDFSISSPSEKSSPVKNITYTPTFGAISSPVSQTPSASHSPADESNFCSLNVPIYDDKASPSLSVVSEEEPESMKLFSLFENTNVMTMTNSCSSKNILSGPISSLELPKLSKNLYDFPILANIYQWSDIFAKRGVKSLELKPHQKEIKRYSRAKSLETLKTERPQMKNKEDVDVDGITTLSRMLGWRERLGLDFYLNSILWMHNRITPLHDTQERQHQETEEPANSDQEDKGKTDKKITCGCFGQCFGKKKKKFFK